MTADRSAFHGSLRRTVQPTAGVNLLSLLIAAIIDLGGGAHRHSRR
jgi:Ethanolamine utilization protein EutJ (predicted chaperonin)